MSNDPDHTAQLAEQVEQLKRELRSLRADCTEDNAAIARILVAVSEAFEEMPSQHQLIKAYEAVRANVPETSVGIHGRRAFGSTW
jgi:uncharacterized protein